MNDDPEVQTLANTVQYQDGGIVSRTILKKEGGNLTLFAFDEGQGLSEHTTPYEALLYLLEGSAQVTIEAKVHQVRAGEALLLPPNVPHAVKATERFKMMLAMFRD